MSREKTLRDSDVNRQLLASSRRVKKLYQFFAVIIATAFISSAITLTISADGPTGFGTVIEPGSMVQDASFIVFPDGGTYYTKNNQEGGIDYSSTNASAAIQYAFNNLTPGRTSQEKVVLKGDFTITYRLIMPSHSALYTYGTITLADAANQRMLIADDAHDLLVVGGTWDGNAAGQGVAKFIFEFTTVYDVTIRDVKSYNSSYDHYIFGDYSSNILVQNCIADGGADDGFNPINAVDVSIIGCIARNMTNDGFHISDGTYDITVSGCIASNNGESGFYQYTTATRTIFSDCIAHNNTLDGFAVYGTSSIVDSCISRGNARYGVNVETQSTNATVSDCIVTGNLKGVYVVGKYAKVIGNTISAPTQDGIRLSGCANPIVIGNTISEAGTYGILSAATTTRPLIQGNSISSSVSDGIIIYGANATIIGNNVWGPGATCINLVAGSSNILVSQNRLISGTTGIYAVQTAGTNKTGLTISNNQILLMKAWGIVVSYWGAAQIIGNYIDGPRTGASANPYDAISLLCSNYTLVAQNHCVNAHRYDLSIYANTLGVRVFANYFGEAAILDSGTSTVFEDNVGYA